MSDRELSCLRLNILSYDVTSLCPPIVGEWLYKRQILWGLGGEDDRPKSETLATWKCWGMFQILFNLGSFWSPWFILGPMML